MNHHTPSRLDRIVAEARRAAETRSRGYRERALRIHEWICRRCGREFTHADLDQLTVHHRDHNHDNNPPDGSNWELLCVDCHENEHRRQVESRFDNRPEHHDIEPATHSPFAHLDRLLRK